jgi:hypothetical protein
MTSNHHARCADGYAKPELAGELARNGPWVEQSPGPLPEKATVWSPHVASADGHCRKRWVWECGARRSAPHLRAPFRTVAPIDPAVLEVFDTVPCKIAGNEYLHIVEAIENGRYQNGNNRGFMKGWIGAGRLGRSTSRASV